jgi:hypothetical protein
MAPLDLNTITAGAAQPIARSARSNGVLTSPQPITSPSGELLGISHFDKVGVDSDHYLSLDLDPSTPPVLFVNTPFWTGNGTFAGGAFYTTEQTSAFTFRVVSYEAPWWTGGQGRRGGMLDMVFWAPPVPELQWASLLVLSPGFLGSGLPIYGMQGLLGVVPTGSLWLVAGPNEAWSGRARLRLSIPEDAALRNVVVPAQSVAVDLFRGELTFGNTAGLRLF